MDIDFEPERQRYRVRWREAGRQRSRRFASRADAEALAASLTAPTPARQTPAVRTGPDSGGVYSYATAAGTRWRFVFRQSDGSLTTRRGFPSRGAAVAGRRTAIEQVRRGEVCASRETFAAFWASVLETRRPYVTPGTLQDYATQGRKRLLPWFGELKLAAIDEDRVRGWLTEMAELVDAGELSAKTVNNARTCLSMTLGEAVRRGQLAHNPCRYVPELPVERARRGLLVLDALEQSRTGPGATRPVERVGEGDRRKPDAPPVVATDQVGLGVCRRGSISHRHGERTGRRDEGDRDQPGESQGAGVTAWRHGRRAVMGGPLHIDGARLGESGSEVVLVHVEQRRVEHQRVTNDALTDRNQQA